MFHGLLNVVRWLGFIGVSIASLVIICLNLSSVEGAQSANKLYTELFEERKYNKMVRPVFNESEKITVYIGLRLSQLIDVDEKNQFMTTSVWMIQEWRDKFLQWDPQEFNGVNSIYVPAIDIWIPDIILYNTAEGTYEPTNGTNAIVKSDGNVQWRPPASFKVGCTIDVKYFPFDQQDCSFQFLSWTYNHLEIDIQHDTQKKKLDPDIYILNGSYVDDFVESVEWDIMDVPAKRSLINYAGSEEQFVMWDFKLLIKRKFLFYTVNLMIPLISHAFITVLVFYIPAASTEKMSLSINILLSLTVFFLMLEGIIPTTSLVVPLLGKYLVFTVILVCSSIIITVITYQVHFRSSSTHSMPDWTRKIFLYWLPKILMMKRPKIENSQDVHLKYIKLRLCDCMDSTTSHDEADQRLVDGVAPARRQRTQTVLMNLRTEMIEDMKAIRKLDMSPEVKGVIEGALFIANHLKKEDQFQRTKEDWKYVALVIDRVFLWLYGCVCLFGTIGILCHSPMLYDTNKPIK